MAMASRMLVVDRMHPMAEVVSRAVACRLREAHPHEAVVMTAVQLAVLLLHPSAPVAAAAGPIDR